jgi:nucleoside-diphosphate-sugar epimerase
MPGINPKRRQSDLVIIITGGNSRISKYIKNAIPEARTMGINNCEIKTDYLMDELKDQLKDAKVIIHTVGKVFGSYEELYEANYIILERVLASMPPDCQFIYISSISVYGKNIEGTCDENTKLNPDSNYSMTKVLAERLIMQNAKNYVILRPGPIFGTIYHDYFKMMDYFVKGKAGIIGSGENFIPFTYAYDVANAIKLAIERNANGIFVICSRPIKQKEAFETMAHELGISHIGRIRYTLALLYSTYSEYISKGYFNYERFNILAKNRIFDTKKAEMELGFKPSDPKEGIREMALFYKSGGKYGKDI